MKNFYEQNLTVTPSLCDPNEKLSFDAILTIFQDVTTTHSNQMGLGHSDMIANSNAFWVLSKTKFKLTGEIKVYNYLKERGHNSPFTTQKSLIRMAIFIQLTYAVQRQRLT